MRVKRLDWGSGMRRRAAILTAAVALTALGALPATAQWDGPSERGAPRPAPRSAGDAREPDQREAEIMVKTALMSFNDANLTGNYAVFHARLAPAFQREFPPARLADVFRQFSDRRIDIAAISAARPSFGEGSGVEASGALKLRGQFDGPPRRVRFDLTYMQVEGRWRMVGINVNVGDSD